MLPLLLLKRQEIVRGPFLSRVPSSLIQQDTGPGRDPRLYPEKLPSPADAETRQREALTKRVCTGGSQAKGGPTALEQEFVVKTEKPGFSLSLSHTHLHTSFGKLQTQLQEACGLARQ